MYIDVIAELKPDFVRKLQDFEVTERENAILEVEISSETADVTWHKVINGTSINVSVQLCLNISLFFIDL
jgi:hypothetical protein